MAVLDYSNGRIAAFEIKRRGHQGAMRYLPKRGNTRVVCLNKAEVDDFRKNEVGLGLVYEALSPARAGEGRQAGIDDAKWALAKAAECGIARSEIQVIYFAVDYDAVPSTVVPYFEGVASMLGLALTGVYGGYRVIKYLLDAKKASWGWQTQGWSKVNGVLQKDPRRTLFQRAGAGSQFSIGSVLCDTNDINKENWGQIGGSGKDDMTPDEMLKAPMPKDGSWVPPGSGTFAHVITGIHQAVFRNLDNGKKIDGLTAAVAASTKNPDITPEEMTAIVEKAVQNNNDILVSMFLDAQQPALLELFTRAVGAEQAQELAAEVVEFLKSQPVGTADAPATSATPTQS